MSYLTFPYSQFIEWMCLIASILFIRHAKPKFWRLFIGYLIVTVVVEDVAYYIAHHARQYSNHWIYNLFLAVYAPFHLWIYSKIARSKVGELLPAIFGILIGLFYLWEWYSQGIGLLFYRTNTVFGVSITILSIYYFYSLFKYDSSIDILIDPSFWFVTGCLFFYATSTGVNALFIQILNGNHKIRYFILTFLNLLMYSCWIKSFLCLHKQQNYIR